MFDLILAVVAFIIVWDFIIAECLGVSIYTFLGVKHTAIWARKNFSKSPRRPATKNNFYSDS
jgi:hypothetical protein